MNDIRLAQARHFANPAIELFVFHSISHKKISYVKSYQKSILRGFLTTAWRAEYLHGLV
jgi:hypothetical protein